MLRARWVPRDQNEEADALTNSDFRHFSPEKRVPVDLATMPFGVLHGLLEKGEEYLTEVAAARAMRSSTRSEPAKKRLKGETLREKQPWG